MAGNKTIVKLPYVPRGKKEILAYYGNPDKNNDNRCDPDWYKENIVIRNLRGVWLYPYKSVLVTTVTAHHLCVDSLVDALDTITESEGWPELVAKGYNYLDAAFFFRPMVGYPALSVHSWGAAIDNNPQKGRFGNLEDALAYPEIIVSAFEDRGWKWGGRWRDPWKPDAMHMQACSGY